MAALRSRCEHYILVLWFLLSSIYLSSYFPGLFSAVADRMSIILSHGVALSANLGCRSETCWARLAGNTGRV